MTVNADLEPKTHHQTPMTCTYGFSHVRHLQNCCYRDENTIFKYMNYVSIIVATDWRSIGGAWPYWPCWAPIVGWGAFGSPGPGPGPPWCGRLPVEPAGLPPRHPGAPTLWLSEVPPSGSPLPFLGGGRGCPCGGSPGGPVPWGASGCLGPGLFRACFMPCGMGCCSPHTLLNVYMEEPYEHKRAHTHRCTLKHSHWCKNRCSQTPIVLICCCFKLIL